MAHGSAFRFVFSPPHPAGRPFLVIGGVVVLVTADRDGRPKRVSVSGPGDYDGPVEGCKYEVTWTAADA